MRVRVCACACVRVRVALPVPCVSRVYLTGRAFRAAPCAARFRTVAQSCEQNVRGLFPSVCSKVLLYIGRRNGLSLLQPLASQIENTFAGLRAAAPDATMVLTGEQTSQVLQDAIASAEAAAPADVAAFAGDGSPGPTSSGLSSSLLLMSSTPLHANSSAAAPASASGASALPAAFSSILRVTSGPASAGGTPVAESGAAALLASPVSADE